MTREEADTGPSDVGIANAIAEYIETSRSLIGSTPHQQNWLPVIVVGNVVRFTHGSGRKVTVIVHVEPEADD